MCFAILGQSVDPLVDHIFSPISGSLQERGGGEGGREVEVEGRRKKRGRRKRRRAREKERKKRGRRRGRWGGGKEGEIKKFYIIFSQNWKRFRLLLP